MEDEDDWEWQIAAARARAASDDPTTDDSVPETDPADVRDELAAKADEEVEDWDGIIATAREQASADAPEPAVLASGSTESLPVARGSREVIEPPPTLPVWTPPVIAADPTAPRTVIPVPTLPTCDPQRVRDYVAATRGTVSTRGRGRDR